MMLAVVEAKHVVLEIYRASMDCESKIFDDARKQTKLEEFSMTNKTIFLSNIEPGEYLSWFATTQAAFKIRMKLYDSKKVYFDTTRRSRHVDPPLSQGSAKYDRDAKELALYVEIPEAKQIQTFLNTFSLLTPSGLTVGHGFTCCGEDQGDLDFNDFYLHVMGWKNQG